MATSTASSLSSSTSSALASAAATKAATSNKVNAQKILTSLGAGSGVDVASLAQNLVDAERAPQEASINSKISKNESRISGYSAISFVLSELKNKFNALKVKSDFNSIAVSNSDTNAFSVEAGAFASKGSFDVQVQNIAKGQRTLSAGFGTSSEAINQGRAFSISLASGGAAATSIDISAANATPIGVVNAINSAGLAVKAELVNSGNSLPAVASTVQLSNVSYGSPYASDNFASFSATIGGQTFSFSPLTPTADSNGEYDLASLAAHLRTQLRTADGGNSINVAVNNNGTGLLLTDLAGRSISNVSLTPTPKTPASAVPSELALSGVVFDNASTPNFEGFTATIGGKTFGLSNLAMVPNINGEYDLQTLATALQTQLRAEDGGRTDLNVNVNGGQIEIKDFAGRDIQNFSLILDATAGPAASVGQASIVNGSLEVVPGVVGAASYSNGSPEVKAFKIMLTGEVGQTNAFTVTSPVSGLTFEAPIQQATNALLTVNGIQYSRSSNKIDDVIQGSTLTLKSSTVGTASVNLARDTSATKTKMIDLVQAFNDLGTILKEVSDPKSTFDTYGATLVADSSVRMIRQQMRSIVLGNSSTPAPKASALWQIGISVNQTGELDLDEKKLDSALESNYDDIVQMFTGNKNLFLPTGTDSAGIAGDAVRKITSLLGPQGPLLQQTESANKQNTKYKDDLTKLQRRMDSLLSRYTKQFAVMDSLVGQTNSMKTSLKSSFEGMMSMYSNK